MPMNPEYLPETALLLAGLLAAVVGISIFARGEIRRGLKYLGIGAASVLLGLFLVKGHGAPGPDRPFPPLLPRDSTLMSEEAEDTTSTSLLLGAVLVRTAASDRYVLAFERRPFLTLERKGPGLIVSCTAGDSLGRFRTRIRHNAILYRSGGVDRLGPHTIRIREALPDTTYPFAGDVGRSDSTDVFRIRYVNRNRIEAIGWFYPTGCDTAVVIRRGVHWPGGGAPPGTVMDLRHFGKGTIDFERSGTIRVRR